MQVRTYKRNRKTIGAITAAMAAGVQVFTHKADFSLRLGTKWVHYGSAEEVVAAIQGAALVDKALFAKLEDKGFPPFCTQTP